jgi:hypothetical protein
MLRVFDATFDAAFTRFQFRNIERLVCVRTFVATVPGKR